MSATSPAASNRPRLVADIGGTHSRCALVTEGRLGEPHVVRNEEHPDITSMLRAGLAALAPATPVTEAAIAIAAPVRGDDVHMTNRGWRFSVEKLRSQLGLAR